MYMNWHRLLAIGGVCAGCLFAQLMEQHTNKENMVHDRGQAPVRRDTLPHGHISAEAQNAPPAIVHGILVDAGCGDRVNLTLRAPAETVQDKAPAQPANPPS